MSSTEPPAGEGGETPPPSGATPPPPPPPPPPSGPAGPPAPPGAPAGTPAYGGPAPAATYNLGDALSYGWAKFQANAAQIVISALVLLVGVVVFEVVAVLIYSALVSPGECTFDDQGNLDCSDGTGWIVQLLASAIIGLFFFVVAQIIGAGIIRGALGITEGKPFTFSEVLRTDRLGPVVVTSLISSAIIFVGILLCYLPGIVAAFFLQYALYFLLDQDLAPVDAIKASVNLVKDNLADVLVWWLVGGIIAAVGFFVCLVGALVSVPVVLIGTAYTYKKLTHQPVAA